MSTATLHNEKKKKLVPKLRFPMFEGEWKVDELGNNTKVTSGGTPSRNKKIFWNGNIPWITTSLIDFNVINTAEEFITQDAVLKSSAKLFPKGTILMAMYGQGKTRGKVAILGLDATTNQACAAILPNDDLDKIYLFQNLAGRYDEIRDLSNEGGQQNLSGGIIKGIKISFPTLPEQQKIAFSLSTVDEKIQQLSRKKELLEQYKKGVMQQLFSGKLRFKDEEGKYYADWEEKSLGDIAQIKSGLSKDQNDNNTGHRVTRIETISSGTINLEKVGYIEICENIEGYKINKGDILFSNINSVAHIGKTAIAERDLDLYHGMNLLCLRSIEGLNSLFLYYFLNTEKLRNYFRTICNQAVNQASINQTELAKTRVPFPSYKEQQKITDFLSSIDTKIESTNQQMTKTQNFKKGLLQQMFV